MVHQPPVILLDEPLSNLDAKLREGPASGCVRLIDDLGITAVLVTHDQVEAMALADHIILLSSGQVEQRGTPAGTLWHAGDAGRRGVHGRQQPAACRRDQVRGRGRPGDDRRLADARHGPDQGAAGRQLHDALIRVERVEVGTAACANSIPMQLATCVYLGERWECLFEADGIKVRCYSGDAVPPGQHHIRLKEESLWLF